MRSFIAILLVALLAISPGLCVYKVPNRLDPKGALRVGLDYSLSSKWPEKTSKNWVKRRSSLFSSHIVFNNQVSEISNGQLWQISYDAITEMVADADQYGLEDTDRPGAMGIMAFGNEIFLTSSQSGGPSYSYEASDTNPVKVALKMCQNAEKYPGWKTDELHKNNGKCVEVSSAQMYFLLNKDEKTIESLKNQKPRVAVWTMNRGTGKWRKTAPCQDPKQVSSRI